MSELRHEMILASAGSGKTYALTNRFVQLLAAGEAPERIVALTFTRKAAGEFFDEILKKLARAAAAEEVAKKLARDVGAPGLGAADFLRMLRAVVEAMPRLSLGTLDGFFARVVRSFPLELGLSGEFQIMEESAARRERRRVLRRMFAAAGEPDAAQREFIEAFKRATFGVEEKRLARVLDGFLDAHSDTFLAARENEKWGEAARIWPDGNAWLVAATRRDAAAEELRAVLPWEALNEKQRVRLHDFFAALPEWAPGAPLPDAVDYLVGNAFKVWDELSAGADGVEVTIERKKVALDARARAALVELVAGIAGAELARRLEMTRGLFAVLGGYERNYHEVVRRAGRLTFADVLRLLLPGGEVPALGSGEGSEEARLMIDWRLDAKFDHWLLDEFQDTSFAQWSVLRSLIDEAVQDPEGRRSLFYVGDVKQAIFAWRGGDPRLFREIFNHYNGADAGSIVERRLDKSYRSGPAVLAMVNRVFGDAPALGVSVPPDAAAAWAREWRAHESAHPELGGWAELRHAEDEGARFAETLAILRATDAVARGLEVAVLVRDNKTAAALADFLRESNVAAVAESDLHVATDNPLTCALLALLRAAAHPGDSLAQGHLAMTPLGALLAKEGVATADAQTARVLGELHADGFAATLERWLRKLGEPGVIAGGLDAFSAERGRMLVGAAADFDESGSRDVAEFLEFAERFTVRDAESAGVVRVMTIHKSKGLGFDVVILPDLEGKTLAARRDGLAVQRADDRSVEWVLELPAKIFAERDPVLAAHVAAAEADAAYESLCLLYVAMTRAKRAMYVITEPIGAKATSRNFPRLLRETLGETWSEGDARWFEAIARVDGLGGAPAEAVAPVDAAAWLDEAVTPRAVRRPSRTPSALKTGVVSGAPLFVLEGGGAGAAEFGSVVHELLAGVEWAGPDAARQAAAWAEQGGAAQAEAAACLTAGDLAGVWVRPTAMAEVWRERAFEVVLDGAWVTGVFDRVIVERAADGRAVRATVFDFKTDRLEPEADLAAAAARHAGQLGAYRRVVAMLAQLPPTAVTCEVMFTRVRRRMVVTG